MTCMPLCNPPAETGQTGDAGQDRERGAEGPKGDPAIAPTSARRARAIRMLAVLALAHVAGGAGAEPDPMRGAALHAQHCAMCHGTEARGDGPLAASLGVQPTNLRALGRGVAFPTFRAAARIDGRDPRASHGSPMPIWGEFFEGPQTALRAASGQPILTPAPVADRVSWLATIRD